MTNKTNIHELVLNDAYFINGGVKGGSDIVQCRCNYKNAIKQTKLFYVPTKNECGITCCYSSPLGVESFTYYVWVNYPVTEYCY